MIMKLLMATTSDDDVADWTRKLEPMRHKIHIMGHSTTTADTLASAVSAQPDVILASEALLPVEMIVSIAEQLKHGCRLILIGVQQDDAQAIAVIRHGVYDLLPAPLDTARLLLDLQSIYHERILMIPGLSSFDHKRVIGKLLISYARRVPADRQLSEQEANNLYGTQFRHGSFRFITVCLDADHPVSDEECEEWLALCQGTVLRASAKLCYESIINCDHVRYHILLNYAPTGDGVILDILRQNLDAISSQLPKGIHLTFCCSQMHNTIFEIVQMLDESGDAIWDRLQNRIGTLLIDTSRDSCSKDLQLLFDNAEQHLKSACAVLDVDQFRKELNALSLLPYSYRARHEMRGVLRRAERYMFEINRDLIASFADVAQVRLDMMLEMRRINTLDAYIPQYTEIMANLFQRILSNTSGQQSRPVRQAQQYIRENYASPLNLDTIARQVGLSPVYFSAVFKKELGIGFSDYLNLCRIEQAKKMLEGTDLKVLAISQSIGFSGPRYFSRVFKSIVGVRPSEYRSAMQRSDFHQN